MKAFSTSACPLSIRVVENELALYLIVNEVHLCPNDEHKSPLVNNDPDASVLNDLIKLPNLLLLNIIHNI